MPPRKYGTEAAGALPERVAIAEPQAIVTPTLGDESATTTAPAHLRLGPADEAAAAAASTLTDNTSSETKAAAATEVPEPRKRGRPRKPVEESTEPPKKRGRPRKALGESEEPPKKAGVGDTATGDPPRKRGRPRKTVDEPDKPPKKVSAGEVATTEPPRKRGRPRKVVSALPETEKPPPKKRGRPRKTTNDDAGASTAAGAAVDTPGKQYWLMKAEQEDREETAPDGSVVNTKFTIDDLREKTVPELWDGVRNPVAAKNMRAMRKGDLAFFYASGGKQGRKPGIVGIMEIVGEAQPDPTVSDRSSIYYREGQEDRWCVVAVEFRQKLSQPVTLADLQKHDGDNGGSLKGMQLFTQTRLSVSQVTPKEWAFITRNLINDYKGDAALTESVTEGPAAANGVTALDSRAEGKSEGG